MIELLKEIQRIIKYDGDWPLRCSLSTNEIGRIHDLANELIRIRLSC